MAALTKQAVDISFAKGLDLKTDPFRVPVGNFLALQNSVFQTGGLLQKRNGFKELTPLSISNLTTLSTFNGGLLAVGDNIQAYSSETQKWSTQGETQNLSLSVLPAVRTNSGQLTADMAMAPNGTICTAWYGTSDEVYYQIIDSTNGNVVVPATLLANFGRNPKVFLVGYYFIVTFMATVLGSPRLRFVAIPINNLTSPVNAIDISTVPSSINAAYDGYSVNDILYIAWNCSDGGGAIRLTQINRSLTVFSPVVITGKSATSISVTADIHAPGTEIWLTAYDTATQNGYSWVYSPTLLPILGATKVIDTLNVARVTSIADGGSCEVIYEIIGTYAYNSKTTDRIQYTPVSNAGSVASPTLIMRGLGLSSKPFYGPTTDHITFLAFYGGELQPTYFLIDIFGSILGKLAYSNAVDYAQAPNVLSSVVVSGKSAILSYLFTDLIQPVNKQQGLSSPAGVYAQKGMNIATFTFDESPAATAEIGGSLHLTGGYLWQYDGIKPVEHGFHVWPESIGATTVTTGGSITAQRYYYVATYEWTDGAGNIHRSAPSVPEGITTTGSTSTNTIYVPTLRVTSKTGVNNVRIVLYRWSTAQQIYYQVTSITSPNQNVTTQDYIAIDDTLDDSSIIGNTILYTTGGVVENIGAPACSSVSLFKSRLLLIPAEDPNNIWYSKQVLSATPVEMSDLFTLYVSPTIGAQGSTGALKFTTGMDDKAICFKKQAIYYFVGTGPDNTGANNDFSEPVFITTTVGCENQRSVVFMPQGLMFQAADGKGIWLLGRDLSTNYVGAPVERYNGAAVLSALNIPGTNQVRFTLDNGVTLMYDYYYGQWGTFTDIPAQSSVVFQGLHTYLNTYGQVFQETPGKYLDGSSPVLMKFTTSWLNLAGLQGFERAYYFYILGTYLSPHKLNVEIAYDYNSGPSQVTLITPDNTNDAWGSDPLWGASSPWGGTGNIEQWRVFLQTQKCQAFQITIGEIFNRDAGQPAGAGLTISGLNVIVGLKKQYTTLRASKSAG